ncbi:DUF6009 family protein [Streptomyces naganishii]|uniref:DUF6009 family protein n=1 Tax=Streptomyces naganishii TaxID=285447 RepID=UPI003688B835
MPRRGPRRPQGAGRRRRGCSHELAVDRKTSIHEQEVVWLENPGNLDYVRQALDKTTTPPPPGAACSSACTTSPAPTTPATGRARPARPSPTAP